MIGFLNLRSLAFYGSAIAGVVVLFSVTTSYGEAHLKAPEKIDGRYRIESSNLPDCFNAKPLILVVQQSGVYLTGSLLPEDAAEAVVTTATERPLLTGQWDNHQLTLQGAVNGLPNCPNPIQIEGTIAAPVAQGKDAPRSLNGVLKLKSAAVNFTAQQDDSPAAAKPHH